MLELAEVTDGSSLVDGGATKKGVTAIIHSLATMAAHAFGAVEFGKLLLVPEATCSDVHVYSMGSVT